MKKQILIITMLLCLVGFTVACNDEKECDRIKSPHINNFLGEYSVTENIVVISGQIDGDTIANYTDYYVLQIKETNDCFDLQLDIMNSYYNNLKNLKATILDDTTFSLKQKIKSAYGAYTYVNGNGMIDLASGTIAMSYRMHNPNAWGFFYAETTGIKQ